jgi:hypothetical protein
LDAPNGTTAAACDSRSEGKDPGLGPVPTCASVEGGGGCRAGSFYAATLLLREHLGVRWVWLGLGRIVALHCRSSTLYQIR